MFRKENIQEIKETWNHLQQSCWTEGKILLQDSHDGRDVARCVRQTIALLGLALSILVPHIFREETASKKWWVELLSCEDIAIRVTHDFVEGSHIVTQKEVKHKHAFASNQCEEFVHKCALRITFDILKGDEFCVSRYTWSNIVQRVAGSTNISLPVQHTKTFRGLGPLFHVLHSSPVDREYCDLMKEITDEFPLYNPCVLKIANAIETLKSLVKYHITDMGRVFWYNDMDVRNYEVNLFTPFVFDSDAGIKEMDSSFDSTSLHVKFPGATSASVANAESKCKRETLSGLLQGLEHVQTQVQAMRSRICTKGGLLQLSQGLVALDFVAKTAKSGFDDIYTSLKLRIIQCGGGFMFSPVNLPLTLNAFKDYAAEHDHGVNKGLFQHSTNDCIFTAYMAYPCNLNGKVFRGKEQLLKTMSTTIQMTDDKRSMHQIDFKIANVNVSGTHAVHVASLPLFDNANPPSIMIRGKGMYNGTPKIMIIGTSAGASNSAEYVFCGYLCNNFIQELKLCAHLSNHDFESKLTLLNGPMKRMVSAARRVFLARHSLMIDVVDFVVVLADQLGFDVEEVEECGWELHNLSIELVKSGCNFNNLQAVKRKKKGTSDKVTLVSVIDEMKELKKRKMESAVLQRQRNEKKRALQTQKYELREDTFEANCFSGIEPTYRSAGSEVQVMGTKFASDEGQNTQEQDEDMVSEFAKASIDPLNLIGEELDENGLGSAYALGVVKPEKPKLALDTLGCASEEANLAPSSSDFVEYGSAEEVEAHQLISMMKEYGKKENGKKEMLPVERLSLTCVFASYKQHFFEALMQKEQQDVTYTMPAIDKHINKALEKLKKGYDA